MTSLGSYIIAQYIDTQTCVNHVFHHIIAIHIKLMLTCQSENQQQPFDIMFCQCRTMPKVCFLNYNQNTHIHTITNHRVL